MSDVVGGVDDGVDFGCCGFGGFVCGGEIF